MRVLKSAQPAEFMVKNSRFLAEALIVHTPDEARELWRSQKHKYDNGGHIVYAFVTGPQGNFMGCSDDGEPSGTAGRPMLKVVKNSGITDLIVTAARWFGGTKLGTGGLVRAYTQCAQLALAQIETEELVPHAEVELVTAYAFYEQLKRLLAQFGFEQTQEEFADTIRIGGTLRESEVENCAAAVRELGSGKIGWSVKSPSSQTVVQYLALHAKQMKNFLSDNR